MLKELLGQKAKLIRLATSSEQSDVEIVEYFRNSTLLVSCSSNRSFHVGQRYQIRIEDENITHSYHVKIARVCSDSHLTLQVVLPGSANLPLEHRADRIKVQKKEIKITLQDGKQKIPVSVADIGPNGARLVAATRLGKVNDVFYIELSVNRNKSSIRLPCKVRYVRTECNFEAQDNDLSYHHGVEFLQLATNVENYLLQFVS